MDNLVEFKDVSKTFFSEKVKQLYYLMLVFL